MKLRLNNKEFIGHIDGYGKLTILLSEYSDKLFFKKWETRAKSGALKKLYAEDVPYACVAENGVLRHCFPIMNANEDSVILSYDYKVKRGEGEEPNNDGTRDVALTRQERATISSALNAYWNESHKQLEVKEPLGDIEREQLDIIVELSHKLLMKFENL